MMKRVGSTVLTGLLVAALAACGPSGPTAEEQAQDTEWSWLQETKQTLDAKRQELAEMRQQVAAAAGEAAEEAEEGVEVAASAAAETVTALEAEAAELTEQFSSRLVAFLNADPMIEGEPPTERQVAALRMKSSEDMVLAREWIDKGGDYKRAIEIYQTALRFDPDNPELEAALAEAEALRFMTAERFAQAKKGMTEDEVRAVLGQVNLHNVRDFPDRKVLAWFFPTGEGGAAAAVWFRQEKGQNVVYKTNFEEVKPRTEDAG